MQLENAQSPCEGESEKENSRKYQRKQAPNVWTGPKQTQPAGDSFEDMMAVFKKQSEEKMADLKRAGNTGHSGYSRRGGNR